MSRNAEARRQADIVRWIRANARGVIAFAVLNDGLYSKSEAAKRKWLGLHPGIPDLAIVHPQGVAFLEIKNIGQTATTEQRAVMDMLESLGARCAVVRTLEEAQQALLAWGVIDGVDNLSTPPQMEIEKAEQ
jgi:hypothetical protein